MVSGWGTGIPPTIPRFSLKVREELSPDFLDFSVEKPGIAGKSGVIGTKTMNFCIQMMNVCIQKGRSRKLGPNAFAVG